MAGLHRRIQSPDSRCGSDRVTANGALKAASQSRRPIQYCGPAQRPKAVLWSPPLAPNLVRPPEAGRKGPHGSLEECAERQNRGSRFAGALRVRPQRRSQQSIESGTHQHHPLGERTWRDVAFLENFKTRGENMRRMDWYPSLLDFNEWLTEQILDRKISSSTKVGALIEVRAERLTSRDKARGVHVINIDPVEETCPYCSKGHLLQFCDTFSELDSPTKRLVFAREKGLCYKDRSLFRKSWSTHTVRRTETLRPYKPSSRSSSMEKTDNARPTPYSILAARSHLSGATSWRNWVWRRALRRLESAPITP